MHDKKSVSTQRLVVCRQQHSLCILNMHKAVKLVGCDKDLDLDPRSVQRPENTVGRSRRPTTWDGEHAHEKTRGETGTNQDWKQELTAWSQYSIKA